MSYYNNKTYVNIVKDRNDYLRLNENLSAIAKQRKEHVDIIKVKETQHNKEIRLNRGFTEIVTVCAKKVKEAFEERFKQPLAYKPQKLKNLEGVTVLDAYPLVTGEYIGDDEILKEYTGKIDVPDGRHRIATAAELGAKIEVATHPEFPIGEQFK